LRDTDRAVRLGLLYAREPDSLIEYLVGIAMVHIGLEQARQVAARAAEPTLMEGYSLPPQTEKQLGEGVRRAVATEFHQFDAMIEDLHRSSPAELAELSGEEAEEMSAWGWEYVERMPFIKPNMTHNLMGSYSVALRRETHEYDPPMPHPQWETDSLRELGNQVGWLHLVRNPIGAVLLQMLTPALNRFVEEYFRTIAALRMTRVHLALRAYQLKQGELPRDLAALTPDYVREVPADPFTRQPFGYVVEADSPVLYSVGPDQQRDPPQMEHGDDIVYELDFPPPSP
jgi:hypothetical protein